MKSMIVALMLLAVGANAKYFDSPFQGGKWYVSDGALFTSHFSGAGNFTNAAPLYHPLSAGSIIPQEFQAYIPPESWSLNLGGGWNNANGIGGTGASVNLLDSVRAYTSGLLALSSNADLQAAGKQIAPGDGPLNITVGPQWCLTLIQNGTIIPFNQWRVLPYWFVGASYGF